MAIVTSKVKGHITCSYLYGTVSHLHLNMGYIYYLVHLAYKGECDLDFDNSRSSKFKGQLLTPLPCLHYP